MQAWQNGEVAGTAINPYLLTGKKQPSIISGLIGSATGAIGTIASKIF